MKEKNNLIGTLYCLMSGVFYGMMGFFGTHIMNQNFSIHNMLFWRFLIGAISIIPILIYCKIDLRVFITQKKKIFKIFIFGCLFYAICASFYFYSGKLIGTGLAMVIFYTYPLFIILLSWFFEKHKITIPTIISLVFIMGGCALIATAEDAHFDLLGTIYATISGLGYAAYIYYSKREIEGLNPIITTFVVCVASAFTFLVMSLFEGGIEIPNNISLSLNLVGLAVICTSLPILFLLRGLKYISATKASILSVTEPLVTLFVGVMVLLEPATSVQLLGSISIIVGALIVQLDK